MFEEISYTPILGFPLLYWLGLIGIIFILLAGTIGYLINSGKASINFNWHKITAGIGITLAVLHVILALMRLI